VLSNTATANTATANAAGVPANLCLGCIRPPLSSTDLWL
jgi:hypothetical protein